MRKVRTTRNFQKLDTNFKISLYEARLNQQTECGEERG